MKVKTIYGVVDINPLGSAVLSVNTTQQLRVQLSSNVLPVSAIEAAFASQFPELTLPVDAAPAEAYSITHAERGNKADSAKPRMDLIPPLALVEVAKALTHGAAKYDDAHNWRKGIKFSRLFAAAQRHILAFQMGQTADPESGHHHLAHAICELMFMIELPESDNDLQDGKLYSNSITTESFDVSSKD